MTRKVDATCFVLFSSDVRIKLAELGSTRTIIMDEYVLFLFLPDHANITNWLDDDKP